MRVRGPRPAVRPVAAFAILALGLVAMACGSGGEDPLAGATATAGMTLSSAAFGRDAAIPRDQSCDGADTSPPLTWSGSPAQTKSFALIVDDPDAGDFTHWVVYDVPATATGLPAGLPKDAALADGSRQGKNGFGGTGYGGPCPPKGSEHHYRFRVYALDATLTLEGGRSEADVAAAMKGHILAFGELGGRFKR